MTTASSVNTYRIATSTMDLGFGASNQQVGQATSKLLLETARTQETVLDDELEQYDKLLEDDDALDMLREKRLQSLKKQQKQRSEWLDKGHGEYTELDTTDIAKGFFAAAKASERLVVHFCRPTTRICDIFHKHLGEIAEQHLETKFLRINVETTREGSGVAYLVEKLGVRVMPTLLCIKNRQAVHHIRGFDELGGTENFSGAVLKFVLSAYDVLQLTDSELDEEHGVTEELLAEGVNSIKLHATVRDGGYSVDDDE